MPYKGYSKLAQSKDRKEVRRNNADLLHRSRDVSALAMPVMFIYRMLVSAKKNETQMNE